MSSEPERPVEGGSDVPTPEVANMPPAAASIPEPAVHHAHSPSDASASEKSSEGGGTANGGGEVKKIESLADSLGTGRVAVIMSSLCMALFLAALDVTIITTALPTIATHFKASSADYTWIGSAYLVACAGSVTCWGKISDIFGRKPALLLANAIFFVGSLLSAVSVSVHMLIGGRVVQGIGGGGLIILVNICISDIFSMRERGKYFGMVGATWAIASAIGPLIGGVFTDRVSWRWCFYINLPLDGTAFLLLIFFLKIDTPKTPFVAGMKAIDWLGVITIVGGVVMFLLGLEAGGLTHPWSSAYVLCLVIFGIFTTALFFVTQWKISKYPLMPLRIFGNSTNIAALAVCYCHGFAFVGATYYLPLYFQTVLSANPILSGVYLFPLAITLSVGSGAVGIVIKKTGRYQEPIWFGLILMTLGFGLFIDIPDHADWAKIIIYQIIAGTGVGPNFQSPLIALQAHVAGHDIAAATATFGFVRQLATSMSVVLGGVIFTNMVSRKQATLVANLGPEIAARVGGTNIEAAATYIKHLPPAQKQVVDQVITSSLSKMFIFYTAVSGLGLVASVFIKKKTLSKQRMQARTGLAEQERVRLEEAEKRKSKRNSRMPTPPITDEKGAEKAAEEV